MTTALAPEVVERLGKSHDGVFTRKRAILPVSDIKPADDVLCSENWREGDEPVCGLDEREVSSLGERQGAQGDHERDNHLA